MPSRHGPIRRILFDLQTPNGPFDVVVVGTLREVDMNRIARLVEKTKASARMVEARTAVITSARESRTKEFLIG